MLQRLSIYLPLVFWLYTFPGGTPVAALTIYRIGGEDLSPPELEEPFDFVQLPWGGVDADRNGSTEHLEIHPDHIASQRLDPGTNLAPLLEARGGRIQYLNWAGWQKPTAEDEFIFDADASTAYLGDGRFSRLPGDPPEKNLLFDFGGAFFIERIRFFPRERFMSERFIEHFIIATRDTDPLKEGTRGFLVGQGTLSKLLDFDIVHEINENAAPVVDLELPPAPISQLLFQGFKNTRGIWEIAEFEIFGAGFTPAANYISNVIDLGGVASLGTLSWSGRQDPGARLDLSMRSGDDDDPNTYWRFTFNGDQQSHFGADGRPLNRQSYLRLDSGERAGITPDTEHWEPWSAPFQWASGSSPMVSARPRSFVQFKVDISSTKEASGQVGFLQFAVSIPPVARAAVAEIVPVRTAPGIVTSFTLKLKASLREADLGFDTIDIDTPVRAAGIDSVRISGQDQNFLVKRLDENGFSVQIPRIDFHRTAELIEVVFRSEVFSFGTIFSAHLSDSQHPHEVPQTVSSGDADELAEGNGLAVDLESLDQKTLHSLRLSPAVFTPNGDGVNDFVRIEYDLLNLAKSAAVRLTLYDLSGRSLGEIFRGEAVSGRFSTIWTGRDSQGALLAPGLYMVQLRVDADQGTESSMRTVTLVY